MLLGLCFILFVAVILNFPLGGPFSTSTSIFSTIKSPGTTTPTAFEERAAARPLDGTDAADIRICTITSLRVRNLHRAADATLW